MSAQPALRRLPIALALTALTAGCVAMPTGRMVGPLTTTSAANRFGIPTQVGLTLPASVVAADAGNYRVQDTVSKPSIAQFVKDNVGVYANTTGLVNDILSHVAKAGLIPGKSYTFPDNQHPGQQLTVMLSVLSDHAVISIGRGTSATGASQLLAISYTNPQQGELTFHMEDDPAMGRFYLHETYDLDAGKATADAVQDTTFHTSNRQKLAAHWNFSKPANPAPDAVAFNLSVAAAIQKPDDPNGSGQVAMTANFLSDASAAAIVGLNTLGTGNTFHFVPNDGLSWLSPHAHDFYLTTAGHDEPAADARATLKAILPTDDTIATTFPADPTQGDPFADAKFAFPATTGTTSPTPTISPTASASPTAAASATASATATATATP